jgi:hypothetical protein
MLKSPHHYFGGCERLQGIKIADTQVYFVKGKMKGRQGRRKHARKMVARVTATGNANPVATILKVKAWANEVGGMKKLKALVDALSEKAVLAVRL